MRETVIEVAGTPLVYREAGTGATVLFLHDAAGASWDPLLDALSVRYRVLAQIATLPADLTEKNLCLFARNVMPYLREQGAEKPMPMAATA